MANPPITIGPFDNVPAPGSPMRSDWPQDISTYVTELGADESFVSWVPTGIYDFYNTAMADWLTGIPQVTRPAWATRLYTVCAFSGYFEPAGWGGQDIQLRMRFATMTGGTVRTVGNGTNVRMAITMNDSWNVSALTGAQQVAIQAQRTGGGTLRADTGCRVAIQWSWRH